MSNRLLFCEDEDLSAELAEYLKRDGLDVEFLAGGAELAATLASSTPDLVVLRVQSAEALERVRAVRFAGGEPIVVLAAGSADLAVLAADSGASASLRAPFDPRELLVTVRRVRETVRRESELRFLRGRARPDDVTLLGTAPAMQRALEGVARMATLHAPVVLVVGEAGTGKHAVAQAVHAQGARASQPFFSIECASLSERAVEVALFGEEATSDDQTTTRTRGLLEVAVSGSVFLDDVDTLTLETQAKLLRAIETGRFRRVGGTADLVLRATLVLGTERDLAVEIEEARFREDLQLRLNLHAITLPPLRDRVADIDLLAPHLLRHAARAHHRGALTLKTGALAALKRYGWPGNVRELRAVLDRVVMLHPRRETRAGPSSPDDVIELAEVAAELRGRGPSGSTSAGFPFELPEGGVDLQAVEVGLLSQALKRVNGNQSAAARLLGISRYALRYRMEKHGLGTPAVQIEVLPGET